MQIGKCEAVWENVLASVMEDYIEILVVVMCSCNDTANRFMSFYKCVFFSSFGNLTP